MSTTVPLAVATDDVAVGVADGVAVTVGVADGVAVGVAVGATVWIGVGVAVGCGADGGLPPPPPHAASDRLSATDGRMKNEVESFMAVAKRSL